MPTIVNENGTSTGIGAITLDLRDVKWAAVRDVTLPDVATKLSVILEHLLAQPDPARLDRFMDANPKLRDVLYTLYTRLHDLLVDDEVALIRQAPDVEVRETWRVGAVGKQHRHRATGKLWSQWSQMGGPDTWDVSEWEVVEVPCPRIVERIQTSSDRRKRLRTRWTYIDDSDFVGTETVASEVIG